MDGLVLVIAFILLLLFHRRKKRKANELEEYDPVDGDLDVVEPFHAMPSASVSVPQRSPDIQSAFYNPFHDRVGGANTSKAQPQFTPNRVGTPS